MAESITMDDVLEAIRNCKPKAGGKGIAVADIAEKTGRHRVAIREDIRRAIAAGTVEVDFESRMSIDGRNLRVPVYRVVKKKPGKMRAS